MSLFVGNLSRDVDLKDLESLFKYYGSCKVDKRPNRSFAFVEFDNEADAEEAKEKLHGHKLRGEPINVEWSKRSNRFEETEGGRSKRARKPLRRNRSNSRSESRSRKRSNRRKRSRSRSRSKSRTKKGRSSPTYSPKKKGSESRSRSKSKSRSKSSSRSASKSRSSSPSKSKSRKDGKKEKSTES
eukprot:TRINITY_DN1978_c0_g1_i2.p2 TRINITY_DN1978_c0_g1~~TRINITY_DN1978_c0_g1_i2.p2  ORF type:complete len:185 (-),score=30.17 TRINITY_DN1978_c0_g1_i2:136-690(-)